MVLVPEPVESFYALHHSELEKSVLGSDTRVLPFEEPCIADAILVDVQRV